MIRAIVLKASLYLLHGLRTVLVVSPRVRRLGLGLCQLTAARLFVEEPPLPAPDQQLVV